MYYIQSIDVSLYVAFLPFLNITAVCCDASIRGGLIEIFILRLFTDKVFRGWLRFRCWLFLLLLFFILLFASQNNIHSWCYADSDDYFLVLTVKLFSPLNVWLYPFIIFNSEDWLTFFCNIILHSNSRFNNIACGIFKPSFNFLLHTWIYIVIFIISMIFIKRT